MLLGGKEGQPQGKGMTPNINLGGRSIVWRDADIEAVELAGKGDKWVHRVKENKI